MGGLCPGGVSVLGGLCLGVSVRGDLCPGGVSPEISVQGGSVSKGSSQSQRLPFPCEQKN